MLSMLVLTVGSGVVGPSSTPQSGWYLLGRDTCKRTDAECDETTQSVYNARSTAHEGAKTGAYVCMLSMLVLTGGIIREPSTAVGYH
jgi:hypothetical protein